MNRLAIIPGHSERKQGAVNKDSGVTEWGFNSRFVESIYFGVSDKWIDMGNWPNLISGTLQLDGEEPIKIFHRTSTITDLVNRINEWSPDLAIEFHCNSSSPCATGTEMVISKIHKIKINKLYGYPISSFLVKANNLSLAISDILGIDFRVAKYRGRWHPNGGYFLNKTNCKAIIAETFFICNNSDLAKANENYDKLVQAPVDWIVNYFKEV